MARECFKLPDLGEGLHEATIRNWLVSVGDMVTTDQNIVEVETQKSAVEIPSPWTGKISALYGDVGDEVTVGTTLFEVETTHIATQKDSFRSRVSTLNTQTPEIKDTQPSTAALGARSVRVMPIVRTRAAELGVDLASISPSGPDSFITLADVEDAVRSSAQKRDERSGGVCLSGMRKVMAENMTRSHQKVVPVTVHEKAKLSGWKHLSQTTPRLVRAMVAACRAESALNVWFDDEKNVLTAHEHVNLGIAVNTERGLFVPVLDEADILDDERLQKILGDMRETVRAGKLFSSRAKATITLSNVGPIGGMHASAIILPPQVAIVVAGRITEDPCVIDGVVEPCKTLPLSLTFDHRVVTGGEAATFIMAMVNSLEAISDYEE